MGILDIFDDFPGIWSKLNSGAEIACDILAAVSDPELLTVATFYEGIISGLFIPNFSYAIVNTMYTVRCDVDPGGYRRVDGMI